MARSHNKKRNVGIIYELLLRYISDRLIENDKSSAQKALNIIENRFNKSSELYKEFRLFNALAKTTVSEPSIATAILNEAKNAARRCNSKKLNYEKSLLIRDINHNLNDKSFYYRKLAEYKTYATIQTLLNEWRLNDKSNLVKMVDYESQIAKYLTSENKNITESSSDIEKNVDTLVEKIMLDKLNTKYGSKLTKEQKKIIRDYSFYMSENNIPALKAYLKTIKATTISNLNRLRKESTNQVLLEKIDAVNKKLLEININDMSVTDSVISKFLTISNLKNEILKEEKNETTN